MDIKVEIKKTFHGDRKAKGSTYKVSDGCFIINFQLRQQLNEAVIAEHYAVCPIPDQ